MSNPDSSKILAEKLTLVADAVSELNRSIQQQMLRASAPNLVQRALNETFDLSGRDSEGNATVPVNFNASTPKNGLSKDVKTRAVQGPAPGIPGTVHMNPRFLPRDPNATTPFVESRYYWGPMDQIPSSFFERSDEDLDRSFIDVQRRLFDNRQTNSFDVPRQEKEFRNKHKDTMKSIQPRKLSFNDELSPICSVHDSASSEGPKTSTVSHQLGATFTKETNVADPNSPSQTEARPWTKDEFIFRTLDEICQKLDAIENRLTSKSG